MGDSERKTSPSAVLVPVVNLVVTAELFWWPFSAKILSVYSVAGSRSCSSYSTVFPDTVRVTSGTKCERYICVKQCACLLLRQIPFVTPQRNRFVWRWLRFLLSLEHSHDKRWIIHVFRQQMERRGDVCPHSMVYWLEQCCA